MPLFSMNKVSFDFGRVPILRNVDLSLEPGERAAIVGRNGVGKSTLFNIIMREMRPDAGTVDRSRRMRIAMLQQDHALSGEMKLFEAVRGECRELIELEGRMERALSTMEALPPSTPEHDKATQHYGQIHHEFESMGGYDLDQRVAATLTGLGFSPEDIERPITQLSGGEQRVAALAATLLQKPDLLLLDEPTNHLDLQAIEWLEGHLLSEKSALLMVSHDRSFLNRLCSVTFHLKDAKLSRYPGNYDFFERERHERDRLDLLAWQRQQEDIARKEDYIRRNIVGQKTKQAQSRRKQLEKMVRLSKPTNEQTLHLRLTPARRGGDTFLVTDKLAKSFGDKKLFSDVDLHIARGEKIGLVGVNGAGKTTLVRILLGRLPADSGSVRPGKDVDVGFFDQHLDLVDDAHTVADEFRTVNPFMGEGELRGQLARFGFFDDDLDKKVGQLSGGERNRLSLLKLVYQKHNFLILDEPTNHLDIPATQSLEDALSVYEGTLLIISHDRSFLDRLAERVIEVAHGKVTDYPGRWAEFTAWKRSQLQNEAARRSFAGSLTSPTKGDAVAQPDGKPGVIRWSKNKLMRKMRNIEELEAKIAEAADEKERLEAKLAGSHELDRDEILTATCRHQELLETISRREERWAKLAESIEEQESLS
ncbi:MAG: ABC-F family ATP-binding cassette domain-containing protein [bacterium]|nr:ABC-F family ATP-binding cassette domain-containing protein [bacterium]